jgi:hypothetical protein
MGQIKLDFIMSLTRSREGVVQPLMFVRVKVKRLSEFLKPQIPLSFYVFKVQMSAQSGPPTNFCLYVVPVMRTRQHPQIVVAGYGLHPPPANT